MFSGRFTGDYQLEKLSKAILLRLVVGNHSSEFTINNHKDIILC